MSGDSEDRGDVVDLAAARREKRAAEFRRKGYRQFAIEEVTGLLYESEYEAQALLDQVRHSNIPDPFRQGVRQW